MQAHRGFADPVAMLPMPRLETRTPRQRDGAACVWCASSSAPVPLGQRLSSCEGALVDWKPKSCRSCVRREAGRVYRIHIGVCQRCTGLAYCPDARALHGLSQPPASVPRRSKPAAG